MMTPETVLASNKAAAQTFFGLTASAFEGMEKLVELNVTASKAALTEAAEYTQSLLAVKDVQELYALQTGALQPAAEKAAAYGRHVYEIASSTGAAFGRAFEAKSAEAQNAFTSYVDSVAKNAPAGSETVMAVVKSAVAASNNAYESVQKAVKQATEMAEANFNAVTSSATSTAKAASKKR